MSRRTSRIRPTLAVLSVLALVGLVVSACTPEPAATPTPTATESTPPDEAGPVIVPDGTAEDNLPLFEAVTAQVWAASGSDSGRAYVDALTAAGFDKSMMQVTHDLSTVGHPAESLQFSVRWGDAECLVGQVGPSTGDPVTAVMDQLAEGRCLIGSTRPIDW